MEVHVGKCRTENFECGLCQYTCETLEGLELHLASCEVYECENCECENVHRKTGPLQIHTPTHTRMYHKMWDEDWKFNEISKHKLPGELNNLWQISSIGNRHYLFISWYLHEVYIYVKFICKSLLLTSSACPRASLCSKYSCWMEEGWKREVLGQLRL